VVLLGWWKLERVVFGAGFLDAGGDAAHIFQSGVGGILHGLERIAEDAELHDKDVHAVVERFNLGGFVSRLDVIREDL
jgi:hypothetical protein